MAVSSELISLLCLIALLSSPLDGTRELVVESLDTFFLFQSRQLGRGRSSTPPRVPRKLLMYSSLRAKSITVFDFRADFSLGL